MQQELSPEEKDAKIASVTFIYEPQKGSEPMRAEITSPHPAFLKRLTTKQKWYRSPKSWIAILAATFLLLFVLLQSNSVFASQVLAFIQNKPVPVSEDNMVDTTGGLSNILENLGTLTVENDFVTHTSITLKQAANDVHFPLHFPQKLPEDISNQPNDVNSSSGPSQTFTFSSVKAHTYLTNLGHGDIKIPANLDGATFRLTGTSFVSAAYINSQSTKIFTVREETIPELLAVGSASRQDLINFMLSLPNLSPLLKEELSQGAVPVEVYNFDNSQSVTVHHVAGILMSDKKGKKSSANFSTLVWLEHGIQYTLESDRDASEIMAVANSLP